jgi:hypothetical protein
MQEPGKGLIPVKDFARDKGIPVYKAIEMLRDGLYPARRIGDSWFVESSESTGVGATTSESAFGKVSGRTAVFAVVLVFLTVGYIFFLAPRYQRDKFIGLITAGTDERKCFNFHKDTFKDPESAYVVDSYVWTKENEMKYGASSPNPVFKEYDAVLRVRLQAKNGFGAYGSMVVECPLKNGKFDRHYAAMWQIEKMYPR